jgi:phosphoribosylaminoimidazole carboxylase (NCAIR synthetase)
MALSELALVSLALSLSMNPSDADIQKYQSLSQEDQVKVQELVQQKDALPAEIEKLKEKGAAEETDSATHAPTTESMM